LELPLRGRRGEGAGERGTAAVEFALVLPLLLMLVLGAIDWGWYFFIREVTINAAREGARVGSVNAVDAAGAMADAHAAATGYLDGLGLTGGTVTETAPTVIVGTATLETVRVNVSYPVGSLTGFTLPGFSSLVPATITATAQMRREGT
jgi:Flp pilus assembly protein TadG